MSSGRIPLLVATALLASAPVLSLAQQPTIAWRSDLTAGRQEAMRTGRNMLVHFWATWCGPCQRLESTVFKHPNVVSTVQQSLVPVKLNADEFPQIAKAYGVEVLPTDVILSPDGRVLARFTSPQQPAAYLAQVAPFGPANRPQQAIAATGGPMPQAQNAYASAAQNGRAPVQSAYVDIPNSGGAQAAAGYSAPGSAPFASQQEAMQGGRYAAAPHAPATHGYAPQPTSNPGQSAGNPAAFAYATGNGLLQNQSTQAGYGGRYGQINGGQAIGQPSPAQTAMPSNSGSVSTTGAYAHNSSSTPPSGSMQSVAVGGIPAGMAAQTQRNVAGMGPGAGNGIPSGVGPVVAQPSSAQSSPESRPPLGLDGFCPVTLKREGRWARGDEQYGIVHRGRLYLFAGLAQKQQFWSDPDTFSPALSGIDPVLALDNGATVLGQREHGVEYNGMVYLFSSESTLQHFSRSPDRYAAGVRQAMRTTGGTTTRR